MLFHCEMPDSFFKTITRASIFGVVLSAIALLVITQADLISLPKFSCASARIAHESYLKPAISQGNPSLLINSAGDKTSRDVHVHGRGTKDEDEPIDADQCTASGYAVTEGIKNGPLSQTSRDSVIVPSWWSSLVGAVCMYLTLLVCTLAGQ